MAAKGGAKTFAGFLIESKACANEVYFSSRHEFSKRACSKTPTPKIWSFILMNVKSSTRKSIFIFALKNQLFPCIRRIELSCPQRHANFQRDGKEK
jgi:hypothetical protein